MNNSDSVPSATITKFIAAPREEVFAAWSDPEIMKTWMGAARVEVRKLELDFRVGGRLLIDMWGDHDGETCGGDHAGEYLEIDPPQKIVFTWISEYTDNQPSVVSIDFIEINDGTEIRLTHSKLPTQEIADQHAEGWLEFADLLNQFIVAGVGYTLKVAYDKVRDRIAEIKSGATAGR